MRKIEEVDIDIVRKHCIWYYSIGWNPIPACRVKYPDYEWEGGEFIDCETVITSDTLVFPVTDDKTGISKNYFVRWNLKKVGVK